MRWGSAWQRPHSCGVSSSQARSRAALAVRVRHLGLGRMAVRAAQAGAVDGLLEGGQVDVQRDVLAAVEVGGEGGVLVATQAVLGLLVGRLPGGSRLRTQAGGSDG